MREISNLPLAALYMERSPAPDEKVSLLSYAGLALLCLAALGCASSSMPVGEVTSSLKTTELASLAEAEDHLAISELLAGPVSMECVETVSGNSGIAASNRSARSASCKAWCDFLAVDENGKKWSLLLECEGAVPGRFRGVWCSASPPAGFKHVGLLGRFGSCR